jgi:hypothetical protein
MKIRIQASRFALTFLFMLFPVIASAEETNKISYPDTAWIMISSALVMLMLPGLALFYGGMVRRKNVLSTWMQSGGDFLESSVMMPMNGSLLISEASYSMIRTGSAPEQLKN